MKKSIMAIMVAGIFLLICGNTSADAFGHGSDGTYARQANKQNKAGGAFITGLKAWQFGEEWGLSPRLGAQLMIPQARFFVAPIFNFGSILLKPDEEVIKRAEHFSFEFLFGFYLYTGRDFDLGLEFGPGYLKHKIETEDGEIVQREMSGINFSYGVMVRLGKYLHINVSLSTSSIGEGITFKPIQSYGLGFGLGWYAT